MDLGPISASGAHEFDLRSHYMVLDQKRGDGPKAGTSVANEAARAYNGGPITMVQNSLKQLSLIHI